MEHTDQQQQQMVFSSQSLAPESGVVNQNSSAKLLGRQPMLTYHETLPVTVVAARSTAGKPRSREVRADGL